MVNNQQITRLSCHEKEAMWFYLMASYGEIYGSVLSVVSMFGLFLYLLTSSDSGSLIIDTLASNGDNVSFSYRIPSFLVGCDVLVSFISLNVCKLLFYCKRLANSKLLDNKLRFLYVNFCLTPLEFDLFLSMVLIIFCIFETLANGFEIRFLIFEYLTLSFNYDLIDTVKLFW